METDLMTLTDIYEQYKPGSHGFCVAVETHCGFEISRAEIERIALRCSDAKSFENAWMVGDWWTDTVAAQGTGEGVGE